MSKSFNWTLRILVAVGFAAALPGMYIEHVASREGATVLPTPGHDVPVKFHSTVVYVSRSEANIYYASLHVFFTCWAIRAVMALIKKAAEEPTRKNL